VDGPPADIVDERTRWCWADWMLLNPPKLHYPEEEPFMHETEITRAIVETYTEKFLDRLESDVVIAGAGPAGLTAAYYLGRADVKVTVFERKLSIGGGTWGGGAGCNVVVLEDTEIANELGVDCTPRDDLYTASAVELASALAYRAEKAGASIFNMVEVEDLVVKGDTLEGVVINSTPITMAGLHVDPVCTSCRAVVDATGHDADLLNILRNKKKDFHPEEIAESFMDVETAEQGVVENTGEVYPGLYVAGMSVCAANGLPRMGPIFGGMLKSGKKVAEQIASALSPQDASVEA